MDDKQAVTVRWPDGSVQHARSATEFLLRTAEVQWSETSHQRMKNQLSKRALAMSGKFIHPFQPDAPFVRELARVGLFKLETHENHLHD